MFGIQCALPTTTGKTTKLVSLCIMANRKSVNTVGSSENQLESESISTCVSVRQMSLTVYTISIACFLKDLVFNNVTMLNPTPSHSFQLF